MQASRSFFMRFKYLILAATLTGLIAGLAYCLLRPQDYVGTTRLFFSTSAVDVSEVYQATLAGQDRVRTYAELAKESRVINNAIKASGVDASEDTVRKRMSVDVPPGTVLIDISVKSRDLSAAVKLSNALADQLATLVAELEKPLGGGAPPVAVTVVASSASTPPIVARFDPLYIGIGVGAGLLAGILGALGFAATNRNPRVRPEVPEDCGHEDQRNAEPLEMSAREK